MFGTPGIRLTTSMIALTKSITLLAAPWNASTTAFFTPVAKFPTPSLILPHAASAVPRICAQMPSLPPSASRASRIGVRIAALTAPHTVDAIVLIAPNSTLTTVRIAPNTAAAEVRRPSHRPVRNVRIPPHTVVVTLLTMPHATFAAVATALNAATPAVIIHAATTLSVAHMALTILRNVSECL
jgi:hypothetical protein